MNELSVDMAGRFVGLILPLLARSVDVDEAVDRVLVRMTDPRLTRAREGETS